MSRNAAEITSASVEKQCDKVIRLCKVLSSLFFIIALCLTSLLAAILVLLLLAFIVPAVSISMDGDAMTLLPTAVGYCSVVTLAWVLWAVVQTMVKTGSPFSTASERGMAVLSILYCLLAGVSLIPSEPAALLIKVAGITAGFVSDSARSGRVSVATIGAAIMFAVLAVVFKYGSLLQRVSDDTV